MAREHQGIPIETWTQETLDNLSTLRISAATAAAPPSVRRGSGVVRGTSVALDIPLDAQDPPKAEAEASDGEGVREAAYRRKSEPRRRDSLKRREALLKGKEGSRRRQRWENDRLIGNPHVIPPEPHDWAPHPTYPVHAVPYFLAPLWDERKAQRAEQERLARLSEQRRQREAVDPTQRAVPRELRERLKKSRAARGLLQSLEEQVREFVAAWAERKAAAASVPEEPTTPVRRRRTSRDVGLVDHADVADGWTDASALVQDPSSPYLASASSSDGEDDDEIVFVGRKGLTPPTKSHSSTDRRPSTPKKAASATRHKRGTSSRSGVDKDTRLQRDKLVFDSLADDSGASFGRWLVHSIAAYYNLRTWSVTTDGVPARREAYVGIPDGHDALPPVSAADSAPAGCQLPRPLWVLV